MPNVRSVKPKTYEFTKEMIEEIYKCKQDPIYFAKNYAYVVHPDLGKIKIELRDYQIELINLIHERKKVICMASRQMGKTTSVTIYMLWYALFQSDKTVAVAANVDRTAKGILDDIRIVYNNLPEWMRIETVEDNAHTMSWINGSKVFTFATSPAGISGESISFLYMDEVAKIEPPTLAFEFWKNNLPTISHGDKVVVTSTPKGVGNLFHKLWKDAMDKQSGFEPIRIDWWQCPEYNVEGWKEEMIRDLGSIIAFNSEYGNQFIGSQATVVSAEFLKNSKTVEPIYEEKVLKGCERKWEDYDPKFPYIASIDIALGAGNDYSNMQIYKVKWRRPNQKDYEEYLKRDYDVPDAIIEKLEQVFLFKSNLCNIPRFVEYVFETLPKWGNPYLILENNGIGQSFVDKMMEEYYYENVYTHPDSPSVGINSSGTTKHKMVNALKEYSESDKILVRDKDTINELMTFIEKKTTAGNSRFQAEEGSHDDLVVALGWACFLADTIWMQDMLTFSV
jgi:hypothetical protein